MIANKEGGVCPRSAGHFRHRISSRWSPFSTDDIDDSLERTREWLISRQHADGHWVGELEGDTILESEYVLLLAFLGRQSSPICSRCARYILDRQLPEGGWSIYTGGPVEVSASVKAYFALKLVGYPPYASAMNRAARALRAHGW